MNRVAFVTCQELPDMSDDDRHVGDILRSEGVFVAPAVWDDPAVDWSRFNCVVIRSTWDYHHRPKHYAQWLRARAAAGTRLWNPASAVIANMDKRYLAALAELGVKVVPSEYLRAGGAYRLRQVLETRGWEEVVVKPAVSASAHGTWRASLATADVHQAQFEAQCRLTDILVQPYMVEIESQGEWSLVFFAGQYGHAALKRPAAGDFRVQLCYGGDFMSAQPPAALIAQAREVLSKVDSPLLYARVDGVDRAGQFILMELEINEPHLFLGSSPEAPSRFAAAIKAVLQLPWGARQDRR